MPTVSQAPQLRIAAQGLLPGNTGTLVSNGWTSAQNYATAAVGSANTFLSSISATAKLIADIPVIADALANTTKTIGGYTAPAVPAEPSNLTFSSPAAAAEPAFATIAALVQDAAPAFSLTAPSLTAPTVPSALDVAAPTAVTLATVAFPAAPADAALPAVPKLLDITVPTAVLLSVPAFSAVLPGSPAAVSKTFSFLDTTYTSDLLTALRAQLLAWVNGASTGLNPAVEQAMWDRGRARETVNASQKAQEATRGFAARGFAKPPGMLAVELARAMQSAQDANSTLSRDITVKQAELEQANRRFAFEEAFKVEAQLVTYNNQIAQRAFDVARYAQDVAVQIYQQNVSKYSADIQGYATVVEQWKAATQVELTKLEKYKADLEGQRLIGTMNEQGAQIYATQVQAAKGIIDLYRAKVEAASALAMVNKTQIDSFAAQVGAYGETVRAKASEYDGYAAQVRGQSALVENFKSQTDAYRTQVEGFKTVMDAKIAAKAMEIKIGRDVPLDLFKARTEVYRVQVAAETSRVGSVAEVYGRSVQAYGAKVQGETGRMGAESEAYRSEVSNNTAAASVRVEVAKANIANLTQRMNLLIDAAKGGAQVSAQMAASALSAVSLSGHVSEGRNFSQSVGTSSAESFNYGWSSSASDSSSDATTRNTNITG